MNTINLPLKRIVLFRSGVGYFEHAGSVEGNAQVKLQFNVEEVNDLLKSMVVQDLGGGQVSTVTYGSKDPIQKALKTFAVDLTEKPTLAQLLEQVRGERVEVETTEVIEGIILGVEHRKRKVDNNEFLTEDVLNLLTDGGLRAVRLESVARIRLLDEKLEAEFRQALAILATGHSLDRKTVLVSFLGEGQREVRLGYIRETPIWKTSYRLVLDEEEPPFLQGWAIVENTTEQDWDNVCLSLVSGRPISFVMDLYQPLYLDRPVVEPRLHASLRPQTYDQDLMEERTKIQKMARVGAPEQFRARARDEDTGRAFDMAETLLDPAQLDPRQGIQSAAAGGEVGELFQYVIDTPVSLPRQQSAMLPIVNSAVEGEKVSIYNQLVHNKHPLVGLKLTNSTDLHLMQGPITVFEAGVYAGDAQIEDLPPGAERLVSYALDLDIEVAPESEARPAEILFVRATKGTLHIGQKLTRKQTYAIKNSGARTKKILVEYGWDSSWKLLVPAQPAEKTRENYRFVVTAESGKLERLAVEEEQTLSEQVATCRPGTIQAYLEGPVASDEIKAALAEIVDREKESLELAGRRLRLEKRIETIGKEQDRIRQNMTDLDHSSELYKRYVKKFSDQEDQIEDLRRQIRDTADQELELRRRLEEYSLDLDLK